MKENITARYAAELMFADEDTAPGARERGSEGGSAKGGIYYYFVCFSQSRAASSACARLSDWDRDEAGASTSATSGCGGVGRRRARSIA